MDGLVLIIVSKVFKVLLLRLKLLLVYDIILLL